MKNSPEFPAGIFQSVFSHLEWLSLKEEGPVGGALVVLDLLFDLPSAAQTSLKTVSASVVATRDGWRIHALFTSRCLQSEP